MSIFPAQELREWNGLGSEKSTKRRNFHALMCTWNIRNALAFADTYISGMTLVIVGAIFHNKHSQVVAFWFKKKIW